MFGESFRINMYQIRNITEIWRYTHDCANRNTRYDSPNARKCEIHILDHSDLALFSDANGLVFKLNQKSQTPNNTSENISKNAFISVKEQKLVFIV